MTDQGWVGQAVPQTPTSEYSAQEFLSRAVAAGNVTAELVLVQAVTAGGVGASSTVDVQPMVSQVDGAGNATAHGVIHGLPVYRPQAGSLAVILDPQVGDIGLAVFCSRDISQIKATRALGLPSTRRRFDWADGVYFGSLLGGSVTAYVEFTAGAIRVVHPTTVTITAPTITLDGNVVLGGVSGGAAVARVGDTVAGGVITSGSAKVTSL